MKTLPKNSSRLRAVRLAKGFTQKKLAEAADTSYQQVQRYESGDYILDVQWAERFAAALGVAPSEIMPEQWEVSQPKDLDPAILGMALLWMLDNEKTLKKLPNTERVKRFTYAVQVCMNKGITDPAEISERVAEHLSMPL